MNLVKFVQGTETKFNALESKDANTLYVITDGAKGIYLGSNKVTGGSFEAVTSYPTTGEQGKLYVNTTDGSVKFYDGTKYVEVVKPYATELQKTGMTDGTVPTSKAVTEYVASQIASVDADGLVSRIEALETAKEDHDSKLAVIQGVDTQEGSIAKAQKDAIDTAAADATSKVQALADGAVKTNTDNITALQSNKADKAATLAGYGITDAYTKTETNEAIAAAVAAADHLKRSIVAEVPAAASADANTIYMKKVGTAEGNDNYEEYMLIDGAVVKIGDSSIDLSGYKTSEQVEAAIATAKTEAINDASTLAYSEITSAIGGLDKSDTAVTGQYVSAVSEENGVITVTRANLPAAATLTTGTENGTVKFNGTDVAVAGLGSAAYTASTAYATAAQGTLADNAVRSVTESSSNGKISVNTGGTTADVAIHGLGSAAYTESGAYATASQGALADTALQAANITSGSENGTIAVSGTDIPVKGLGTAAYQNTSAFDTAGSATAARTAANTYTDQQVKIVDDAWRAQLEWTVL